MKLITHLTLPLTLCSKFSNYTQSLRIYVFVLNAMAFVISSFGYYTVFNKAQGQPY